MRADFRWRLAGAAVLVWGVSMGTAVAQTSATVKDDLFAGTEKFATGASEVTEVSMDPDTLNMVGGHDAHRAHNMVLNVVKTYEYPKPGLYNIADVEAIRARLNTGDWHCSVHTRELKSGESTDICYKRRSDNLVEKAIITVEPKELTFIHQIQRDGGGDGSHLAIPEVGSLVGPEMAGLNPAMEASMAAMEAKMAALGPVMEAKMAGIAPQLQAQAQRLAEEAIQLHGNGPDAEDLSREVTRLQKQSLNGPSLEQLQRDVQRAVEQAQPQAH